MLKKLLRYDLKALNKILIPIHAAVLIITILSLLAGNSVVMMLSGGFIILGPLFYLLLIVAVLGTQLLITMRYHKNFFTDEAYLTYTLPVTRKELFLSKLISGLIWACIDIVVVFACFFIFSTVGISGNVIRSIVQDMLKHSDSSIFKIGSSLGVLWPTLFFFIFVFFACITMVFRLYAAVSIGRMFRKGSIALIIFAYFILNEVESLLQSGISYITGLSKLDTLNLDTAYLSKILSYVSRFTITTLIVFVIATAIYCAISYYVLDKKRDVI